jgi:amino acid transporter
VIYSAFRDGSKRLFVGRPLRTAQIDDQLLPKRLALPVFASDPISSVAYATEQILLVLGAAGAAYLVFAKWVAVVIAALLLIVVLSYRQTCRAYPNGGGAYAVSKDNLGTRPALIAASALLVDYVMTVVVSVVAGVLAITSAEPRLAHLTVPFSVGATVILTVLNLRGVRESGRIFAIPTYAFIVSVGLLFVVAAGRYLFGSGVPAASTAHEQLVQTAHVGGIFTLFLILRAFASGCTALTGVEAISNGVPSFRPPKAKNAAATLLIMAIIAIAMFVGVTALALILHAQAQADGNPSVISQIAAAVFGAHAPMFYVFQAATAGILILAANTAFNGFPVLASILAHDRFLPRQLYNRGDRLAYSNGILLLAVFSIALIIGFKANLDKLIQLYIIGVFTSFTLSQSGMIVHWRRVLATVSDVRERTRIRRSQAINAVGAVATGVVLVIVAATKIEHGAYIAIAAMVALYFLMQRIRRHYERVAAEIAVPDDSQPMMPARNHAIVLVGAVTLPVVRALAYAKSTHPTTLEAVSVAVDPQDATALREAWGRHRIEVPLHVLDSPYREITRPVIDYAKRIRRKSPRDVVTVFIPEYVVGHWWEHILHNQSALRLKGRLLFQPGVMVTSVPWQLRSSEAKSAWLSGASTAAVVPLPEAPSSALDWSSHGVAPPQQPGAADVAASRADPARRDRR